MKITTTLFLLFLVTFSIYAQKDTIYDHSFIQFHLYGKGEPVFVLSGGPGNDCHQEEDVAIRIGTKYMAILLEQRGTGLSMPSELNFNTINLDAYIKDILFVMDSLKLKKAKFYGHSWGAMLASSFASEYPSKVSSLVLTGAGYIKLDSSYYTKMFNNRNKKLTLQQRKRFNELDTISLYEMTPEEKKELAILQATSNLYDTSNKEWKFKKIMKGIKNDKTRDLIWEDLNRINFNICDKLKTLHAPIIIITCKEDPLAFFTEEYKKYIPQSEIHWLNHCGHFPMYEQPQIFYPILMKSLKR